MEKVTGNTNYFARTGKGSFIPSKDIDDLKALHRLSKNSGLTLQKLLVKFMQLVIKDERPKKSQEGSSCTNSNGY